MQGNTPTKPWSALGRTSRQRPSRTPLSEPTATSAAIALSNPNPRRPEFASPDFGVDTNAPKSRNGRNVFREMKSNLARKTKDNDDSSSDDAADLYNGFSRLDLNALDGSRRGRSLRRERAKFLRIRIDDGFEDATKAAARAKLQAAQKRWDQAYPSPPLDWPNHEDKENAAPMGSMGKKVRFSGEVLTLPSPDESPRQSLLFFRRGDSEEWECSCEEETLDVIDQRHGDRPAG